MAINTRGAGKMYLDAMLTLWEQRKREEEQMRQQQAAMRNTLLQNQLVSKREEEADKRRVRENMRQESVSYTNQLHKENQQKLSDLGKTITGLGDKTTDAFRGTQMTRNTDATYRQLMQNAGIPDPGLSPGQYKTYYENMTKQNNASGGGGTAFPPATYLEEAKRRVDAEFRNLARIPEELRYEPNVDIYQYLSPQARAEYDNRVGTVVKQMMQGGGASAFGNVSTPPLGTINSLSGEFPTVPPPPTGGQQQPAEAGIPAGAVPVPNKKINGKQVYLYNGVEGTFE